MKGPITVLALIVLVIIVAGQQTRYRRDPPKPSEFPRASDSCLTRKKLYVSAVAGVPAGSVSGSALVSCQFTTLDCRGNPILHASYPAPGHQDVCNGWVAARDAIAGASIEMCCDPTDASETPAPEDPKKEEKCPPPAGWFDTTSDCREKRDPFVSRQGTTVLVSICDREVFRSVHPAPNASREELQDLENAIRDEVRRKVGRFVCCDKFREAVRTGVPCDPSADVDCDGIPNNRDGRMTQYGHLPNIDLFNPVAGSRIDPFPPGLNVDDEDFLPDRTARESRGVGECPCKWELIKGERKCSPDRRQPHVYLATWRCPTTKAEVITTRRDPATTSCP